LAFVRLSTVIATAPSLTVTAIASCHIGSIAVVRIISVGIRPRKVIIRFYYDRRRGLVLIISDWGKRVVGRWPGIDISLPKRLLIVFLGIAISDWRHGRHGHIGGVNRDTSTCADKAK
jgi:hypothetical protein